MNYYEMYLLLGIAYTCLWRIMFRPQFQRLCSQLPTRGATVAFFVLYVHLWFIDMLGDMYRFFIMGVPFSKLWGPEAEEPEE